MPECGLVRRTLRVRGVSGFRPASLRQNVCGIASACGLHMARRSLSEVAAGQQPNPPMGDGIPNLGFRGPNRSVGEPVIATHWTADCHFGKGVHIPVLPEWKVEQFPDALAISNPGEEQPDASNMPNSTLPDPTVLITQVEPIHGYGDYSAYEYSAVPWTDVTAAEIACMQDQGWPVVAFPGTDTGIDFRDVPLENNQAAQIDFARCAKGLNLPDYDGPSG